MRDWRIQNKLYFVIGLLVLNLLFVIGLAIFGMEMLSGVRAFVNGESLYAKAQKQALHGLSRYILTKNEEDFQEYVTNLSIPLGDRKARLALLHGNPDKATIREGF